MTDALYTEDGVRNLHLPASQIYGNLRTVSYPDGTLLVYLADAPIFRERGWVLDGEEGGVQDAEAPGDDPVARSARRARHQVRDICWCTSFSWFVTFTLDREKIDRYDFGKVLAKLKNWLDNNVRRRGLAYVIVPERHKDGAIHFHGFLNGALDADMRDSGHRDREGHKVYNLDRWGWGFTTAVKLYGDYHRAVGYVLKYITKSGEKLGGRWYYSGGALWDKGEPLITVDRVNRDLDMAKLGRAYVQDYTVPALDCRLIVYEDYMTDPKTGEITRPAAAISATASAKPRGRNPPDPFQTMDSYSQMRISGV